MDYSLHNFVILIFILIIIALVIVGIYYWYQWASKSILGTLNKLVEFITDFDPDPYQKIDYPDVAPSFPNVSFDKFNSKFGDFLAKCNMSAFNLDSEDPPQLPDYVTIVREVGPNGFLFHIDHEVEDYYVMSFRGTQTSKDILVDLDASQVPFRDLEGKEVPGALVHRGFYRLWKEGETELNQTLAELGPNAKLAITGHSLGCGGAALTASSYGRDADTPSMVLYLFAPPRVGNRGFVEELNKQVDNNWVLVNQPDVVPSLPPMTFVSIGHTWLYDNFDNRIFLNLQTGTIKQNHSLSTYVCGIDRTSPMCPGTIIWRSRPQVLINKPLNNIRDYSGDPYSKTKYF